jgi:hypothetical protein
MFGTFTQSMGFGERPAIKQTITAANLTTIFGSANQLWYDFSNAGSSAFSPLPITITSGSNMTGAKDISFVGTHGTNSVTNFKYATNQYGTLSAADLTAGGHFTTNSTTSFLSNLTGMTVIVVCKPTVSSATFYLCNTDQGDLQIYYSGGKWNVKAAGGTGVSPATLSLNTWQIHSFVYNGGGATSAQKLRYRYNKSDQTLSISGTITATSGNSNDNYVWGASDNSNVSPFKGYIGEVMLFNKALTAGEVAAIETYLGGKWGV